MNIRALQEVCSIDEKTVDRLSHVLAFEKDNPRYTPQGGWIYFIRCHHLVKVGTAKNVATRLTMLQIGCPYPLTLLGSLPSADAKQDEAALHDLFQRYHERGEWYELPQDLVALIVLLTAGHHPTVKPDQQPAQVLPYRKRTKSKAQLMPGWIAYGVRG
jgi:hypothetical protein